MSGDAPFGFDRSGEHKDVCEEMARLARLRLEDALVKTDRSGKEVVFGCIATDERMEFTGMYESISGGVQSRHIKMVHNEMMAINPDGEVRKEYLLHTHPGSPHPSVTDVGAVVRSLTTEDMDMGDGPMPPFDGFFNIGFGPDDQGVILGMIIEGMPNDEEFGKILSDYRGERHIITQKDPEDRKEHIQKLVADMSKYVRTCEEEFRLVQI